ncbi:MAG TPA: hypothetical protein DCE71_08945, partial [Parachlamydiales bacterium]|nr:hypothetical protein [Parachlamydiales bacterium]
EFGVDDRDVEKVSSHEDLGLALKKKQGILIFPGGNAAFLQYDLNSKNLVVKVKAAVSNGWNCMGFCAGANVFCQDSILYREGKVIDCFRKYGELPTVLPNVCSHVPYFPVKTFSNQSVDNSRLAFLRIHTGERFQCFWNDGGYFTEQNGLSLEGDCPKQLAWYDEPDYFPQAAVIKHRYGKGSVTVSALHPELPFHYVQQEESKENKTLRTKFLQDLFRSAGIEPKKAGELISSGSC